MMLSIWLLQEIAWQTTTCWPHLDWLQLRFSFLLNFRMGSSTSSRHHHIEIIVFSLIKVLLNFVLFQCFLIISNALWVTKRDQCVFHLLERWRNTNNHDNLRVILNKAVPEHQCHLGPSKRYKLLVRVVEGANALLQRHQRLVNFCWFLSSLLIVVACVPFCACQVNQE